MYLVSLGRPVVVLLDNNEHFSPIKPFSFPFSLPPFPTPFPKTPEKPSLPSPFPFTLIVDSPSVLLVTYIKTSGGTAVFSRQLLVFFHS
jgi:hypothetical protein